MNFSRIVKVTKHIFDHFCLCHYVLSFHNRSKEVQVSVLLHYQCSRSLCSYVMIPCKIGKRCGAADIYCIKSLFVHQIQKSLDPCRIFTLRYREHVICLFTLSYILPLLSLSYAFLPSYIWKGCCGNRKRKGNRQSSSYQAC